MRDQQIGQHWSSVEDLRVWLDPVVAELGCMPSAAELDDRGLARIKDAIQKFGGYASVGQILGYPVHVRCAANKRWHEVEDLRSHLDPIVLGLGRMPKSRELNEMKRGDLVHAITDFGGMRRVALQLGYVYGSLRRYQCVEDMRSEIAPLVEHLGHIPGRPELMGIGRGDLWRGINKFGGYTETARALGYPAGSADRANVRWHTVEDLRVHLDPVVDRLQRMPRKRDLVKLGHGDLVGAIRKFGGLRVVANRLGYIYDSRCTYDSAEDLRPELDLLVLRLGHMPSKQDLIDIGQKRLRAGIQKFGGFIQVAESLGYPARDRDYYPDVEVLRAKLNPIVAQLGRMPSRLELAALGHRKLDDAVGKFGTYSEVAETLGYRHVPMAEKSSARLRAKIASGSIYNSKLEQAAAPLMTALGLRHFGLWVPRHSFDYGDPATGRVVEINGCYHHDHRVLKPACPVKVKAGAVLVRDEQIRDLARIHNLRLLELWECERDQWPEQLATWLA